MGLFKAACLASVDLGLKLLFVFRVCGSMLPDEWVGDLVVEGVLLGVVPHKGSVV